MSVQPSTFDFVLRQPVLLIGAEPLARRRLEGILLQFGYEPESLCSAGSMAEARASFSRQPASVALVDPDLPDGNGMDLISEMYAANPDMTIVVVSAWRFEEDVLAALRRRLGLCVQERDDIEVGAAIRSALSGGAPLDPFVTRRLIQEFRGPPVELPDAAGPLSPRESQILSLVAAGLGNREIAEQLHLSRYTVERHIKHIYRKLLVSSRTKAVHAARARLVGLSTFPIRI